MWLLYFVLRIQFIFIKSWRLFYKVKLPFIHLNRKNMQVLEFVFSFNFLGGMLAGVVLRPYLMKLVAKFKK